MFIRLKSTWLWHKPESPFEVRQTHRLRHLLLKYTLLTKRIICENPDVFARYIHRANRACSASENSFADTKSPEITKFYHARKHSSWVFECHTAGLTQNRIFGVERLVFSHCGIWESSSKLHTVLINWALTTMDNKDFFWIGNWSKLSVWRE